MYKLYNGDCLEIMDKLIAEGIRVDAIITDPPYGTTSCPWDFVIPFNKMWEKLNLLTKDKSPTILFAQQPFTSELIHSNINMFRHNLIWEKDKCCNFLHAKNQPRKITEDIIIFSKKDSGFVHNSKNKCTYNPQMSDRKPRKPTKRTVRSSNLNMIRGGGVGCDLQSGKNFIADKNYPSNLIYFATEHKDRFHPTQKPVALMEYLIKTYTNEGETVLDFTMGSGSTGVACINTNRNFIGIELDENYFKIAETRLKEASSDIFTV